MLQWGPLCEMATALVQLRCHPGAILDIAEDAMTRATASNHQARHPSRSSQSPTKGRQDPWEAFPRRFLPSAPLLGNLAWASAQSGRQDHALLSMAARELLSSPRPPDVDQTCELAWALAVSEHYSWRRPLTIQNTEHGELRKILPVEDRIGAEGQILGGLRGKKREREKEKNRSDDWLEGSCPPSSSLEQDEQSPEADVVLEVFL